MGQTGFPTTIAPGARMLGDEPVLIYPDNFCEGMTLPPLPEPERVQRGFRPDADVSLFTAEKMQEYARLAVLQERARLLSQQATEGAAS